MKYLLVLHKNIYAMKKTIITVILFASLFLIGTSNASFGWMWQWNSNHGKNRPAITQDMNYDAFVESTKWTRME